MRKIFLAAAVLVSLGLAAQKKKPSGLDRLAEEYVKLGLAIGQYDGDFVDAYYGPEEWKPTGGKLAVFPKDSFLLLIEALRN